MYDICLTFFPLPYIFNGMQIDGHDLKWPDECKSCKDLSCAKAANNNLSICSKGFSYQRFLAHPFYFASGGFIGREQQTLSAARKKVQRNYKSHIVSTSIVNKLSSTLSLKLIDLSDRQMQQFLKDYDRPLFEKKFLDKTKKYVMEAFSTLHDYRTFVGQVNANINVLIENNYKGGSFEEKLSKAQHEEKAIYYTSKLMKDKLLSVLFLQNPDKIIKDEQAYIRLYPLVDKYIRIYQVSFEKKQIKPRFKAISHGTIKGNYKAVSIIPHTLVDNAFKYAPKNSSIEIDFLETHETIQLLVSSFGPEIKPDEFESIFYPFHRGEEAKKAESEGTGFGLYLSRYIARKMKTDIFVKQDKGNSFNNCCWTTFSIAFYR